MKPQGGSSEVLLDSSQQQPKLSASAKEICKMLQSIEDEILPKTRKGVRNGNKVFGAALFDKDLNLILAETNDELNNPLFHGEVTLINEWCKITNAGDRGRAAQEAIFLSTHEPCCMCISSIVWAGFKKVYYLFPYAITSAQGIPHDIQTMHELWGVSTYRKQNRYCSTACLMDLIHDLDDDETSNEKKSLLERQNRLISIYEDLSTTYHDKKDDDPKNSLVLG